MNSLPRVALGALHDRVDHRPVLWGLLQRLATAGIQTQCFLSESRFVEADGASAISGRCYRHLDPWLMDADICREVLSHGSPNADLSIVELGDPSGNRQSLERLCQWLELPQLLVVDAGEDDPCRLPPRPGRLDGILLTGLPDADAFGRQRLRWETLWGAPVLGGLVGAAHACAIVQRLPVGARPSAEVCRALGKCFQLVGDAARLTILSHAPSWQPMPAGVFAGSPALLGLKIAVAYDEAFGQYFADTLDVLELNGAALRDFSPLSDPDVPSDVDIVYLGGGNVERFAEALSDNPCMIAALRRHAQAGGRIYAEGGAAAYLCHQIELESGRRLPMCGMLPAIARFDPAPPPASAVEITLSGDCWLGRRGDQLRGYRNPHWRLEPLGPLPSIAGEPKRRFDLLCRDNVIASQIHLNLVAQPRLLSGFATAAAAAAVR